MNGRFEFDESISEMKVFLDMDAQNMSPEKVAMLGYAFGNLIAKKSSRSDYDFLYANKILYASMIHGYNSVKQMIDVDEETEMMANERAVEYTEKLVGLFQMEQPQPVSKSFQIPNEINLADFMTPSSPVPLDFTGHRDELENLDNPPFIY